MSFNSAKNFLDRLISLRDIESQTSKKIELFAFLRTGCMMSFQLIDTIITAMCSAATSKHCVEFRLAGFSTKKAMTVQS
jgi:hypothetical protein